MEAGKSSGQMSPLGAPRQIHFLLTSHQIDCGRHFGCFLPATAVGRIHSSTSNNDRANLAWVELSATGWRPSQAVRPSLAGAILSGVEPFRALSHSFRMPPTIVATHDGGWRSSAAVA